MTAKAPVMPRKPMSRQAIREVHHAERTTRTSASKAGALLADREELVRQIHAKTGDIQEFFRLLNSNTTMWDATQPDPAPRDPPAPQLHRREPDDGPQEESHPTAHLRAHGWPHDLAGPRPHEPDRLPGGRWPTSRRTGQTSRSGHPSSVAATRSPPSRRRASHPRRAGRKRTRLPFPDRSLRATPAPSGKRRSPRLGGRGLQQKGRTRMTQAQGNRIQLGQKVRDPLPGLVGQVVTISDWLYGCTRIGIQPDGNKDGKPFDIFYIDEPQVEIVEETKLAPAPPRHGPRPDEGRRAEGSR